LATTLQQRADRIRAALKRRDEQEAVIARELREAKEEIGNTARWLTWTATEFGWGRSTTYRHLDPKQMQKHREQEAERYAEEVSSLETADEDADEEYEPRDYRTDYVITHPADTDQRIKLAVDTIREGYRALAKKNHPDLGGDTAAMAKLSEERDWVLNFVVNPPLLVLRA
jgi:hypothetical protein